MLSIKDLHKYYKSKKGEDFHALKGIDIEFPKTGFVFIIGKSGSGKSTLLNVLGGLDRYDSGEILIKGKSSHKFSAKEWDSYRNTYLGFVFQDFNIIDSYSIGANIALALQLQGVKALEAKTRTLEILKNVEAENLYDRKPNELSGGQRQRIAIARALVKNPEIIIADEPTGNLDSETSAVIMRILQNLAKERLVIMVTHDLDYANDYGQRIIEMKDGEVINDSTIAGKSAETVEIKTALGASNDTVIKLPKGTSLTQSTIDALNALVRDNADQNIYITASKAPKLAKMIDPSIDQAASVGTTKEAADLDYSYAHDFKLIKSKLPFRNSLNMALSAIWSKKFKLLFASILFIAAIGLFGFSRTVTRFDFPMAATLSYQESQTDRVFISKQIEVEQPWGDIEKVPDLFTAAETNQLASQTGLNFGNTYDFMAPVATLNNPGSTLVQGKALRGILEVDSLSAMNLTLAAGEFPQNTNQVLITDYIADELITTTYQAYLDTNPTLDLPFKTVDIVGVVGTDYRDFTFLNTLNDSQLVGEQQAVLSFRNNDAVLYSRIIVPKGFYNAYDDAVTAIINYYQVNLFLDGVDPDDDFPYEYLGGTLLRQDEALMESGYVAYFDGYSSVPDNGILLDIFTYQRVLFREGQIASEDGLNYLNEYDSTLAQKVSRLESDGFGALPITTTLNNSVNNSWNDNEAMIVVGVIDFERYKQDVIYPALFLGALDEMGIDYVDEASFTRYGYSGYLDYLNSLRTIHLPGFPTLSEYLETAENESWQYREELVEALFDEAVDFVPDSQAYGYSLYLTDTLNDANESFLSFANYQNAESNDFYSYLEYLQDTLDDANEAFLDPDDFRDTYLNYGEEYVYYLSEIVRTNNVDVSSIYEDANGGVIMSNSMYDEVNPFTADKVHGLVIQLSDDTEQNYEFFTAAAGVGISHLTPSGELLQVFSDFTTEADAIFGYVSIGFAGFAALLLFLNISQSILAKKKEIGTLRAMGARGNDVATIFINEASILGIFSALLAVVGITIATVQLNVFLSNQLGLDLSIFNLSPIITLEMLGLTMVIVLLAAFLPVKRVSSMKPIDAIKNK